MYLILLYYPSILLIKEVVDECMGTHDRKSNFIPSFHNIESCL